MQIQPLKTSLEVSGWSEHAATFLVEYQNSPRIRRTLKRFVEKQYQEKCQAKERIPCSLRIEIFERDAYRCQHCGDWHDLTVDHIIPESRGGTLALDNLQTLCRSCNSRKKDKIQWR